MKHENEIEYVAKTPVRKEDVKMSGDVKPRIYAKVCKRCMLCAVFCPDNAITISSKPSVDYNLCKGCLICLRVCPYNAVNEER